MGMLDWIWGGGDNAVNVEDMGRAKAAAGASMPPIPTRKPTNTLTNAGFGGFFDGESIGGLLGGAQSLLGDYYDYRLLNDGKYVSPSGTGGYTSSSPKAYTPSNNSNNSSFNNMGIIIGAAILGATALIAVILD